MAFSAVESDPALSGLDRQALSNLSEAACRAILRVLSGYRPDEEERRHAYGIVRRYLSVLETLARTWRTVPCLVPFRRRLLAAGSLAESLKPPDRLSDAELLDLHAFCIDLFAM
jgi:hypothetical protein